ncbi:transcription repressor OFP8-like [Juglans microcarpa x Juglans regia]|uniref:transcription repressor OFP8-like n=1 Tax=Juglans microcarpa x Juglans regia TaxID=2249226 RepID=UPI001B7F126D|nr:transcription repressor OFP8-like [Juglans microcarpa x Juglans regia]
MENRFKLRISRLFRASIGSCRSRNHSDVVEKAVFVPQNHQKFHMIEPALSPKHRAFRSICRPKPSQTPEIIHNSCIIPARELLSRRKVSEPFSPFASANPAGRTCRPPASPISPLNPFFQFGDLKFKQNKKGLDRSKNKKKKKTTQMKNKHAEAFPFSSFSQEDMSFGGWWYSSEEDEDEREDETDTLFSSKSLSSDSSESQQRRSRRKRYGAPRTARSYAGLGLMPMQGKVKDSFAVVKRSSDPYNDFRTSMVEMIVEKQMFAAKDLEQLLQCFLSLNSYHHHKIIVEAFTEICEALFCNWS